jgi:hypothetical protein
VKAYGVDITDERDLSRMPVTVSQVTSFMQIGLRVQAIVRLYVDVGINYWRDMRCTPFRHLRVAQLFMQY